MFFEENFSYLWEYSFTWHRCGWNCKALEGQMEVIWIVGLVSGPILQFIIRSDDIWYTCIQLNRHCGISDDNRDFQCLSDFMVQKIPYVVFSPITFLPHSCRWFNIRWFRHLDAESIKTLQSVKKLLASVWKWKLPRNINVQLKQNFKQ